MKYRRSCCDRRNHRPTDYERAASGDGVRRRIAHTGPAHARKPKKIDAAQMKAIDQVLNRVIAYRNGGKDEQADLHSEHLLRLLHATGVLSPTQWRPQ